MSKCWIHFVALGRIAACSWGKDKSINHWIHEVCYTLIISSKLFQGSVKTLYPKPCCQGLDIFPAFTFLGIVIGRGLSFHSPTSIDAKICFIFILLMDTEKLCAYRALSRPFPSMWPHLVIIRQELQRSSHSLHSKWTFGLGRIWTTDHKINGQESYHRAICLLELKKCLICYNSNKGYL